jgi:hypothetical protein
MPTRPKVGPADIVAISNGWVDDVLFVLKVTRSTSFASTGGHHTICTKLHAKGNREHRWNILSLEVPAQQPVAGCLRSGRSKTAYL